MQLLWLTLLAPAVTALVCFENDKGEIKEVSNDSWEYCVLIPQNEEQEGKMFGIGSQEDSVTSYESSFKHSDSIYKVLTVCLLEKYDMSKLYPRYGQPEFLFRCMCNYDRCNSHQTFSGYLNGVRRDNS